MVVIVLIQLNAGRGYRVSFQADDSDEHTLASLSFKSFIPFNVRTYERDSRMWIVEEHGREDLDRWVRVHAR